jgi:hypothetical protein
MCIISLIRPSHYLTHILLLFDMLSTHIILKILRHIVLCGSFSTRCDRQIQIVVPSISVMSTCLSELYMCLWTYSHSICVMHFHKIIIISIWHKDTGVISKHYHLNKWINLQGKIINIHIKKMRVHARALGNPMFNNLLTRTKILCFWRY